MVFLFWTFVLLVAYATVGYPLLVLTLARLYPARKKKRLQHYLSVDFVIPAHNEGSIIAEKLRNTLEQAKTSAHDVRIILLSDGSTDDTLNEAQSVHDANIEIIDIQPRMGKVNALNVATQWLEGDVVVYSDANSILVRGALDALLSHYGDPEIGGVCGAIQIAKSKYGGIAASEGLYWRYEQAVKAAESDLGGAVSAQGTLHSVRKEFVDRLPLNAADDFTISVRVVAARRRLVFEPSAIGIEEVTEKVRGEFMRRVRSTEHGWRALMSFADLLNPAKTGFYALKLISHKLLRRLVPFFVLMLLAINASIAGQSELYALTFAGQLFAYCVIVLALLFPTIRRAPGIRHLFFAFMALAAMGLGIINYYRGKSSALWTPVRE